MTPEGRIDLYEYMASIQNAAEMEREKRRKEIKESLKAMNDKHNTESAKCVELFKKTVEQKDKDLSEQMKAEIARAQEKDEKKIREEYKKKYGDKDWNEDKVRRGIARTFRELI